MMFDNRQHDDAFVKQLASLGLDLTRPQKVEHFLYFERQESAERAAQQLRSEGYGAEVSPRAVEGNWLVLATGQMGLAEERISRIRAHMEDLATIFGGQYDGWGIPFGKFGLPQ